MNQCKFQRSLCLCLGALSQPLSGCIRLLCPGALDPVCDPAIFPPFTFFFSPLLRPKLPSTCLHQRPGSGPPASRPACGGRGPWRHGDLRRTQRLRHEQRAPSGGQVQGSNFTPHHYKPFSSHAHYQQVMRALRKLQESGFYWGAVGGREASSLLRSEPPGTFLIRDSSDHHHFFTLSVQTSRGTKNLRIHSEGGGFFLQPDPQSSQEPPQFDCVLKLIAHYMGKGQMLEGQRRGMWG
ncbi:hypothetical protein INR49_029477 [Caranx melampygus]|nr:hypothetical protein INR49_029477 [Caranx melampygus]